MASEGEIFIHQCKQNIWIGVEKYPFYVVKLNPISKDEDQISQPHDAKILCT